MLISMMLSATAGLGLPVVFAIGTGLPVILFSFVIAFSIQKIELYFKAISKFEYVMRIFAGIILSSPVYTTSIFILKYFQYKIPSCP